MLRITLNIQEANIGAAILNDFDIAERALKTSQESAGSALAENEVYLQSIQGKLDKLSATWQSLSNSLLNSDTVKTVISGADTLLGIIKSIVDNLGLMPGLVAAIATAWSKANNVGKECALLPGAAQQLVGCYRPSTGNTKLFNCWEELKPTCLLWRGNPETSSRMRYAEIKAVMVLTLITMFGQQLCILLQKYTCTTTAKSSSML